MIPGPHPVPNREARRRGGHRGKPTVGRIPERFSIITLAEDGADFPTHWRLQLNGGTIAEGPIESLHVIARLIFCSRILARYIRADQVAQEFAAPDCPERAILDNVNQRQEHR